MCCSSCGFRPERGEDMEKMGDVRSLRLRVSLAVAATLVLVLAVIAALSASSASGAKLTGKPITFGTIVPINTPTGSWPGVISALNAGATAINKSGGINGHPVKIWTCKTPVIVAAQEVACARRAAASPSVALIGDLNGENANTYGEILAKAGLPDIANTGPLTNGYTGNTAFPTTWSLANFFPCVSGALARQAGGNKLAAVVIDHPSVAAQEPVYRRMAKAEGINWVKTIKTPITASDYSSAVAEAQQTGANIVMILLVGNGPQAFVRASSGAGAKYRICTALGLSGFGGWGGTGRSADKLYVGADFRPLGGKNATIRRFESEMAAQARTGDKNANVAPEVLQSNTVQAWLGLQIAAQAAKKIKGPITRASLRKALSTTNAKLGGIIPDINFASRPLSGASSSIPLLKGYERVWSSPAYLWKWNSSAKKYSLIASYKNTFKETVQGKK